jgi:nucleotide-binding universal stress UspA family protein
MEGRIVVGMDDSEGAHNALAWAAAETRVRGAHLEIVHAYSYPVMGDVVPAPEIEPELAEGARAELDAVLAEVDLTGVEYDIRVEPGPPAMVLVETAKGADLLVVGSRGRGGFAGLLLGSVSQQVAHHAPCPIVIVPAHRDDEQDDPPEESATTRHRHRHDRHGAAPR